MARAGGEVRIAELARLAGVGIETVRYYERRGLVRAARRTAGGDRRYDATTVRRLRFIKRAQRLKFSLAGVADLFRLHETHDAPCAVVRMRAEEKMKEIAKAQRELGVVHATLTRLVASCHRQTDARRCPMLDALLADAELFPAEP